MAPDGFRIEIEVWSLQEGTLDFVGEAVELDETLGEQEANVGEVAVKSPIQLGECDHVRVDDQDLDRTELPDPQLSCCRIIRHRNKSLDRNGVHMELALGCNLVEELLKVRPVEILANIVDVERGTRVAEQHERAASEQQQAFRPRLS